jgi:hypothetical protein
MGKKADSGISGASVGEFLQKNQAKPESAESARGERDDAERFIKLLLKFLNEDIIIWRDSFLSERFAIRASTPFLGDG